MIILHNSLDWVSVNPSLRWTSTAGTDAATGGFFHCFCGLSKGTLFLREGLGVDSYPYGPGIGAQSPTLSSGWIVSGKRPVPPNNTERMVTYPPTPKRNFRGHGSSSQAGPSRAGPLQVRAPAYVDLDAQAAATLPLSRLGDRAPPATAAAAAVTPLEPLTFAEPFIRRQRAGGALSWQKFAGAVHPGVVDYVPPGWCGHLRRRARRGGDRPRRSIGQGQPAGIVPGG